MIFQANVTNYLLDDVHTSHILHLSNQFVIAYLTKPSSLIPFSTILCSKLVLAYIRLKVLVKLHATSFTNISQIEMVKNCSAKSYMYCFFKPDKISQSPIWTKLATRIFVHFSFHYSDFT